MAYFNPVIDGSIPEKSPIKGAIFPKIVWINPQLGFEPVLKVLIDKSAFQNTINYVSY